MNIKCDPKPLLVAIEEAKKAVQEHIASKDALLSALQATLRVADSELKLAISGPHIDLENRNRHFYEVHLTDGDREARTRIDGDALPSGFSYLMESGLGYAEDLICEALSQKAWSPMDPMKKMLDRLIATPDTNKLGCTEEVVLDVRVGGPILGRVVYHPHNSEERRFQYLKWAKGFYRTLGFRATLQEATDALLRTW